MMKGFLNLFRKNETEYDINIVVEAPMPDFSREMTIIESSEEEEEDGN